MATSAAVAAAARSGRTRASFLVDGCNTSSQGAPPYQSHSRCRNRRHPRVRGLEHRSSLAAVSRNGLDCAPVLDGIACKLGRAVNTAGKWRKRYAEQGMDGLRWPIWPPGTSTTPACSAAWSHHRASRRSAAWWSRSFGCHRKRRPSDNTRTHELPTAELSRQNRRSDRLLVEPAGDSNPRPADYEPALKRGLGVGLTVLPVGAHREAAPGPRHPPALEFDSRRRPGVAAMRLGDECATAAVLRH